MNRWTQRLETATNIAVLTVCLLIGGLFVRGYLIHRSMPGSSYPASRGPLVGSKISVPKVQWDQAKSNRTIILALSTECHYCAESVPFYKKLVQAALEKNIPIVAVLPQPSAEATSYLQTKQLAVSLVVQSPLAPIDVSGTPTLILVDSNGRVVQSWVGKLPSNREAEVLAKL